MDVALSDRRGGGKRVRGGGNSMCKDLGAPRELWEPTPAPACRLRSAAPVDDPAAPSGACLCARRGITIANGCAMATVAGGPGLGLPVTRPTDPMPPATSRPLCRGHRWFDLVPLPLEPVSHLTVTSCPGAEGRCAGRGGLLPAVASIALTWGSQDPREPRGRVGWGLGSGWAASADPHTPPSLRDPEVQAPAAKSMGLAGMTGGPASAERTAGEENQLAPFGSFCRMFLRERGHARSPRLN